MIKTSNIGSKTAVIAVTLIVACIMQWLPASAQPLATIRDDADGTEYMAGQILIKFKDAATDGELADAVKRGGLLRLIKHIQTEAMKAEGNSGISQMWTGLPVRLAIQALKNIPAIEFAEPNFVYKHQAVPNDPFFVNGSLWGMYGDASVPANQYGSQAAEAWAAGHTGSRSVVVGVIDEGIQFTHPDLSANIWTNPYETSGDGIDNDGNGYVDDIRGWNCIDNNNNIYTVGNDAHGSHVSGTIGGINNAIGVVGINWNVTIISGKFLGPNGGSLADAVEAVDYFTNLKIKHPEMTLVALNNSWGGGGYSQSLHDAIIRAANANILFIAAAGNGNALGQAINNDTSATYPANYNTTVGTSTQAAASYNSVIAVTAIDSAGAKATWANYGATKVHLGAPGVNINSTLPTDTYGAYSGTSMATPHVTGAAALYASMNSGATAPQIRSALLAATTPTASLTGKTSTGGRLDISKLLPITTAPAAPVIQSISGGNATVTVTWSPAAGASSYKIYRRTFTPFAEPPLASPSGTSYTDNTVVNGTTYYYVVKAVNSYGSSPESNEVSATPIAPPNAPSGLTATAISRSQINLSWTASPPGQPVTGYKIERSKNGGSYSQIATVGAGVTSYNNTGLSRNTTYSYRVRAYNAAYNSSYSNTATAKTF